MMADAAMTEAINAVRRCATDGAMRRGLRAAAVLLCLAAAPAIAQTNGPAANKDISARRAAEIRAFTDAQIIDGFFKVTFGAEFHTAGRIDRIRKFDVPVRAYVDNRGRTDRSGEIGRVIADIGRAIDTLE